MAEIALVTEAIGTSYLSHGIEAVVKWRTGPTQVE